MLSDNYRALPLPEELESITIPDNLATKLNESYAWVEVDGAQPFASLLSPAGTDEGALYHFIDNATLNHHSLNRFLNRPVTSDDVLTAFQADEVKPVAFQYLGSFLLQQAQQNDLLLPLMDVLSLANYDAIGVFSAMIAPNSSSVVDDIIDTSARLLARLAPKMITLDHVPEDTDYILPPHMIIAIEDSEGNPSDIPVGLLDWLPAHITSINALADGDKNGLLNYLNSQSDATSQVVRDWLIRDPSNETVFATWIFQNREQVK